MSRIANIEPGAEQLFDLRRAARLPVASASQREFAVRAIGLSAYEPFSDKF
jgi:hypothetical protein